MKIATIFLPLIVSITALVLSVGVYTRADAIAEAALRRREQQMVDRLNPQIQSVYRDFGIDLSPESAEPRSLEDLFLPMIGLVTNIQDKDPQAEQEQ
ncbi:MAG: hypothetical protein U0795_24770 [Pirellulales bacterium]